ncbi:CaiB/BaiF CoA transferase family protein [Sphingomonas sp.]|uniref:CaiB/BaiF CoA transferase family protein n=1 Tax=Sphingomonas sp. TaxID=28214 RepID=UPI002DD6A250|nr:CoA transferase [Sphingomonas sp.]
MSAGQPKTPPLRGIRVLDLSRVLAAPFCAMTLGDLGAEVVKVESPRGGDQTRHWGTPVEGGERTYYLSINRNKRAIAVDFSKPAGAALLADLAARSDVLIENYMLGTLERYGLGYDQLRARNPGLIYCSISGYGRTGAEAHRPGYDSVIQAESGLMSVTGPADGEPYKVGVPVCDITAGMYAIQAILAALFRRERFGEGEAIDISLFDCTMANHASVSANALLLERAPGRFGNSHADILPQGLYETATGPIVFHVGSDEHFRRLARDVLEDAGAADDPRFATNEDRRQNRAAMEAWLTGHLVRLPREVAIARLHAAGIPAGLVQDVLEALESPVAKSRGIVQVMDHPTAGAIRTVASPLKMSRSETAITRPPPLLGQHTREVLVELGLDTAAITALYRDHIVA